MASIEQRFRPKHRGHEFRNFWAILILVLATTRLVLAFYDDLIDTLPVAVRQKVKKIQASFEVPVEKKKIVVKKKEEKIVVKKEKPKSKPKQIPVVKPKEKPKKKVETKTVPDKKKKKEPRKVYGVKRNYSNGLGSGGTMSDAVVGKVGNTINKKYDDIKATKEDLKGPLVSSAAVTKAPSFKKRAKPEITKLMKENSVEGVIKVRVLVDIDGRVKKAIAKNDLGFGSKKAAVDACFKMLFSPAMRDGQAVAVWIVIPVRFVKIS